MNQLKNLNKKQPKITVSFRIDPDQWEAFGVIAKEKGVTKGNILQKIINEIIKDS